METEIRKRYALIQWEDLLFTVIDTCCILVPRKDAADYQCGDRIKARYSGKVYNAVICELNENKTKLNEIRDDPIKRNDLKFFYTPEQPAKQGASVGLLPLVSSNDLGDKEENEKLTPIVQNSENVLRKDMQQAKSSDREKCSSLKRKNTDQISTSASSGKKKCPSSGTDEAKEENRAAAKVKRIREKERASVISSAFLTEIEPSNQLSKEATARERKVENDLAELKDQLSTIYAMVEQFLQCKSCLRKAYKKLDYTSIPVPMALTPTTPKVNSKLPARSSTPVSLPVADNITSQDESCPTESNFEESLCTSVKDAPEAGNDINDDDLVYLGKAIYGVQLRRQDYERAHKTAKTDEKLCLNLIEFLLSEEEMTTTTVYGNVQHKKKAMDDKKVGALKSHVMARSGMSPGDFNAKWAKIVVSINNKIRKRKN